MRGRGVQAMTSNTIPRHLTRVRQGEAETIADLVLSHVVEKLKVLTSKVPHLHALLKLVLRNDSIRFIPFFSPS